jgi:ribosomal protein L21E
MKWNRYSIQEQEQDIVHSKQDMPTSNSSSINLQSNNHNPTTDSVVEEMPDNQNHVRLETMATFHHASQHHTYRDSILYNHNRNVGIQDIEDDVSITSESNPKLTHDKILNVKDIDFDHDPSKQEVSVSSPVVKETNEDDMFVPEEEEKPLQRIRIIGKDRKLHGKYGTVLRKERQYFIIQVDGMEGEFRKTIKTIEFLDEPPSLDKNPTSSTGTTIMDLNQTTVKKNIPNRDMPTEKKGPSKSFLIRATDTSTRTPLGRIALVPSSNIGSNRTSTRSLHGTKEASQLGLNPNTDPFSGTNSDNMIPDIVNKENCQSEIDSNVDTDPSSTKKNIRIETGEESNTRNHGSMIGHPVIIAGTDKKFAGKQGTIIDKDRHIFVVNVNGTEIRKQKRTLQNVDGTPFDPTLFDINSIPFQGTGSKKEMVVNVKRCRSPRLMKLHSPKSNNNVEIEKWRAPDCEQGGSYVGEHFVVKLRLQSKRVVASQTYS